MYTCLRSNLLVAKISLLTKKLRVFFKFVKGYIYLLKRSFQSLHKLQILLWNLGQEKKRGLTHEPRGISILIDLYRISPLPGLNFWKVFFSVARKQMHDTYSFWHKFVRQTFVLFGLM